MITMQAKQELQEDVCFRTHESGDSGPEPLDAAGRTE